MKKHFYIAMDDGTKKEVFGEPLAVGRFKCFYLVEDHGEFDKVTINEYYSGMKVCDIITPDFISPHRKAEQLFNEHDEQTIIKHCKGVLQHAGLSYPLNV